jgi:hypothetical protein
LPRTKHSRPSERITKAAEDAAHGTNKELDQLGKAAENGVGDLAQNVMNRFGSSTPKGGNQRQVSTSIERLARQSRRSEEDVVEGATTEWPEAEKSNKSSDNASKKVGQIRKEASAEHNKLRQTLEDGPQALGRSVDSSPKTEVTSKTKGSGTEPPNLSQRADDEEVDRERLTRLEKEAVGSQASRAVENGKDLGEQAMDKTKDSLGESKFSEGGDFSLVDVTEWNDGQTGPKDDKQSSASDSTNEVGSSKSGNEEDTKSTEDVSSKTTESVSSPPSSSLAQSKPEIPPPSSPSPSQSRKRSPSPSKHMSMKSKIPQAKNKIKTSPTKKILTPAMTTTSMASHSHAVIAGTSEMGKSNNGS